MEDAPQKTAQRKRVQTTQFVWFFIFTTVFALVVGSFWFMSPLGLGFQDWPDDPTTRKITDTIYRFSYFIGLPLLAFGQVGALTLFVGSRKKLAYWLPSVTIGIFCASVAVVLWMIESGP